LITSYDNFLSVEDHLQCYSHCISSAKWKFENKSKSDDINPTMFWYLNLNDDPHFTKSFLDLICAKTNNNFKLISVYANGQTTGQCGSMHFDSHSAEKDAHTFLYYVNTKWEVDWGGSTVFEKDGKITTVPFIPNAGLLFDPNIKHVGMDPSNNFKGLRITVAFKLYKD